jgi:hypothetical protein
MQHNLISNNYNPNNLKTLLDQFTPQVIGIFWITPEDLNQKLLGFDEVNYFFDGLISQYLYNQIKNDIDPHQNNTNIFFTTNFNQRLFLAHIKMNSAISGILDEHIALIQESFKDDRNKILIFNTTSKDMSNELEKRYPRFEFIKLIIN